MVRVSSVVCEGGILNSTQIGANQSQGGALFASRTMLVPFEAGKQRSAGLSGRKQMEPVKPIFWANGGEWTPRETTNRREEMGETSADEL